MTGRRKLPRVQSSCRETSDARFECLTIHVSDMPTHSRPRDSTSELDQVHARTVNICVSTRPYAVVPLQTLDQRSGGPLKCGQGKLERSCVEPLRLLAWRRCRRPCPNTSARPLRPFTGRNRVGFWRRWCASSEIWISPKRPCMRHSPPLWNSDLRLEFRTSHAPG